MSGILAGSLAEIKAGAKDHPERLKQLAAEFESLLLAQLLKSMREATSSGWLGAGEDQAGVTMVEMAEQQFAQLLASQGGLGLADLIVQGLSTDR
jgi:flagellar protein FlgJ